jgi:phosphatidylethanolamine-binding protein
MVDQDVTRNGSKTTILHWFQPNLVATPDMLSVVSIMDGASTAIGASYIPPTPPMDDTAHRYSFVLFEQPNLWVLPADYVTINPPASTSDRIGFDLEALVAASGLGEAVAANYLRVINGTAAQTSSAATESYESATSTSSSDESEMTSSSSMSMSMTMSEATSATGEAGSATSTLASATASATDGAVVVRGSTKELLVGLAMGVVGAGLWMM